MSYVPLPACPLATSPVSASLRSVPESLPCRWRNRKTDEAKATCGRPWIEHWLQLYRFVKEDVDHLRQVRRLAETGGFRGS